MIRWCELLKKTVDAVVTCAKCDRVCRNADGWDNKPTKGHSRHIVIK
jgi:hypothetical protein